MAKQITENYGSSTGMFKQVIFALIVAAGKVELGLVTGWSAVLPKMQADNAARFNVTDSDVTLFVSLPGVTGAVLTLFLGPLMELVGPKRFLLASLLPAGFAFLLQAFTPFLSLLYLGRVFTCIGNAAASSIVMLYIAELCEPRFRGLLLSAAEINFAAGQMMIYVLAQYLPWDVATAVCSAPVFLFGFLTLFVPESPYWLARRGQTDAALKSLGKLRDKTHDIHLELVLITENLEKQQQSTFKDQLKQLGQSENYRPILLLMAILILREVGGIYIVISYSVYLFRMAGVSIDAFTCTVLVGAVRLVFTSIAAGMLDHVGRRPLLIATTFVCGVAEVVGAIFLSVDMAGSSWVPLAAILVFVSSYGLGLGPIPWALMGELIPMPVRSIGSSLCSFIFFASQFIICFLFPILLKLGLGGAFLVFASAHAILTLLLCLFLPETRSRSLSDLQEVF